MTWQFLHVQRQMYKGKNNWGVIHIINAKGKWEKLCHSYELPWKEYQAGELEGKSVIGQSRVNIGVYALKARFGGPKGWRLELEGTGHRKNIQVHRAHRSLVIEGCILPVHFSNYDESNIQKGDAIIQSQSVALMQKIKNRHDALAKKNKGSPSLELSANMPAAHSSNKARVNV